MSEEKQIQRRAYFCIIPSMILEDKTLDSHAKVLYASIAGLHDPEEGGCYASNDYFEKLFDWSKRTLQNTLEALVEKGYIERKIESQEENKKRRRLIPLYDKHSRKI